MLESRIPTPVRGFDWVGKERKGKERKGKENQPPALRSRWAAVRAAQDKQTRYVLLARQQPPVAFQAFAFEIFGGLHSDAFALSKRLQGLLNQAIIAQEDMERYFVLRRVSFIIAAAVGRELAEQWV